MVGVSGAGQSTSDRMLRSIAAIEAAYPMHHRALLGADAHVRLLE